MEDQSRTTLSNIEANQSRKRSFTTMIAENEQLVQAAENFDLQAKMKRLQANSEDFVKQSDEVEEIELEFANLEEEVETLEYELLWCDATNNKLSEENATLVAYLESTERADAERDAERRAVIQKRRSLEDGLGYWFGQPWTAKNPKK